MCTYRKIGWGYNNRVLFILFGFKNQQMNLFSPNIFMCPDKYSFFVKLQFTAINRVRECILISVKDLPKTKIHVRKSRSESYTLAVKGTKSLTAVSTDQHWVEAMEAMEHFKPEGINMHLMKPDTEKCCRVQHAFIVTAIAGLWTL